MTPPSASLDLTRPGNLTRVLLDGMTEGVSLAGEDGIIAYTNPAEDRMFGYAPGELAGRHVAVQTAYPPEDSRRRVAEVMEELGRSGHWQGEWRNRRKDGSAFTSRTRISTVDLDGRRHWLCVREDVTEEIEAARTLAEERTRLDLATRAAGIGIWDWDPVAKAFACSGRFREIFGLPPEGEVAPERLLQLVHPEDRAEMVARSLRGLDPAARSREPFAFRVTRPDGAVRWVLTSGEASFEEGPEGPRAVRFLGAVQDITDRRAGEEAERVAGQRLRLALEAGRMAVWDADLANDTVTGTPELNRLLGFPDDEPLDRDAIRARYAPGEPERLRAEGMAAIARGESSIENEFLYVRPDIGPRWLHLRCELEFDAEGRPVKAIGVVSDETARRRAAEDLRASEARLQLASAAVGAGIWDWDVATGTVICSPEEFALLGIDPSTPPERVNEAWLAVLHPEDRDFIVERMEDALRNGQGLAEDYRVVRADGTVRWLRTHAVPVPGSDGRTGRLVGIELDVTAEREEAQALRARAEALRDEVEERRREQDRFHRLSNDLFAVVGFDGFLRSINPAWTRLLGFDEGELLSRPYSEFIHPDDRDGAQAIAGRLRAGLPMSQYVNRMVARDGRVVWLSWAGVPEGSRFYTVGRDVTREREREEILRQSQKMEALGQLTGGIAHDFNNLLQAVQGSLALIGKRPDEPERVRLLAEQGLEAARRGGALTAQLLAFSRSQQLETRPVPVCALLEGLGDLLRRSLGPMVELALDLPAPEVVARADATQLEMAMLNLCINARDAMPGGGPIAIRAEPVRLEADPELGPGDYVLLEVRDQGVGMPPEVAERAFEPFFTTKGVGKGTGLGLSQVYAMARQAGGTARIESAPDRGTTVRLWLPRAAEAARPAERDEGGAPEGSLARTGRVLVIDDDPDVRRWLVTALRSLGHQVTEAADGPAGLLALDGGLDAVIVDFAMPGMTGAEVAAEVLARRPGLPVILATGYADFSAIRGGLPRSQAVLRKPFGIEELEATLGRALRGAERAS